jgi:hypothetical protein
VQSCPFFVPFCCSWPSYPSFCLKGRWASSSAIFFCFRSRWSLCLSPILRWCQDILSIMQFLFS